MDTALAAAGVPDGHHALASGDWQGARDAFAAALEAGGDADPEALDGLGRALWWLRDPEGAVASRERAYSAFRREGELARAARLALWLSREYATVWGNEAAARGWLSRAERLLRDAAPGAGQEWLELARSERERDPAEAVRLAASALAGAAGDLDLEIRALAQLGLAEVSAGAVDDGLGRLDEAMAAASAGESASLETYADVCCTLMLACDLAGDRERPRQWSRVVDAFLRRYEHVPLLAFCRTCCADVYAATGRVDDAETELVLAIRELTAAGQRSRCAHPAAKLAAIRVLQGRFEEADELLAGLDGAPEAVEAAASRPPPPPCSSAGSPSSVGRTSSRSRCSRSWSRHDSHSTTRPGRALTRRRSRRSPSRAAARRRRRSSPVDGSRPSTGTRGRRRCSRMPRNATHASTCRSTRRAPGSSSRGPSAAPSRRSRSTSPAARTASSTRSARPARPPRPPPSSARSAPRAAPGRARASS